MARRGGAQEQRSLCAYMAETNDSPNGIKDEVIELMSRCIQDKIFSENKDMLLISRDDVGGRYQFDELSWDSLRKVQNSLKGPRKGETKADPVSVISNLIEGIEAQATEDEYDMKKIVYFTELIAELSPAAVRKLFRTADECGIMLSIIVPNAKDSTDIQTSNVKLLKNELEGHKSIYVYSISEMANVLANTTSKKVKRANPWNVELEIGPDLSIKVQSFILTKRNVASDLKTAIQKNVQSLLPPRTPLPLSDYPASSLSSPASQQIARTSGKEKSGDGEERDEDYILTAEGVEKEVVYTDEDGNPVDPGRIIPAYYFGERIVTFDKSEQEKVFDSGPKCLVVLLFCPREKICPAFQLGEGSQVIYPDPKDPSAYLKLDALVKALDKTGRVAVVKKIYRLNAKLHIGVLSPSTSKEYLVYTEVCFADDISLPYFSPLLREDELSSEVDGLSVQDDLMDNLIMSMGVEDFSPLTGPVDPEVHFIRDSIVKKAMGKALPPPPQDSTPKKIMDNIDIYFEGLVNSPLDPQLLDRLTETFPLKVVPVKTVDIPTGPQYFPKRESDEPLPIEPKKIKVDEEVVKEEVKPAEDEMDDDMAMLDSMDF